MNDSDRLLEALTTYTDAESSIALYLEAAALEKKLAKVKSIARGRIETYLRETGEPAYDCKAGKAAYTQPKTPRLNRKAWQDACLEKPELAKWQRAYDIAVHDLDYAQEPFKELPEPTLRITG